MPRTIRASREPGEYGAKAVLLDIEGVICVGEDVLPGSLAAIRHIRDLAIPHKFITNTTRRPRRQIVADLAHLGIDAAEGDVFTPSIAARELLVEPATGAAARGASEFARGFHGAAG